MPEKKSARRKVRTFIVFLLLALLGYNVFAAYTVMVRTVRSVAQSQMEDVASRAIHSAIASASCKVDYNDLVRIHRGSDGNVETITLNPESANKLKSQIGLSVLDYLNKSENYTIGVPLGNFCGSEFLSGVGPEIKFRIIPCNISQIDFESKFTSAGINQVLHTLSVRVDISIGALLPGFEEISDLSSSAVITETVIVGDVPQTYFNIQK